MVFGALLGLILATGSIDSAGYSRNNPHKHSEQNEEEEGIINKDALEQNNESDKESSENNTGQ